MTTVIVIEESVNIKGRLAAKRVSEAVQQQLASSLHPRFRSISDLLLNDHFALGYIYGFTQQANRHMDEQYDDHAEEYYVEGLFADLLDKPWTARSYVTLSEFERKNTTFDKGYRVGLSDLNDWLLSCGTSLPMGLAEHLHSISCKQ